MHKSIALATYKANDTVQNAFAGRGLTRSFFAILKRKTLQAKARPKEALEHCTGLRNRENLAAVHCNMNLSIL